MKNERKKKPIGVVNKKNDYYLIVLQKILLLCFLFLISVFLLVGSASSSSSSIYFVSFLFLDGFVLFSPFFARTKCCGKFILFHYCSVQSLKNDVQICKNEQIEDSSYMNLMCNRNIKNKRRKNQIVHYIIMGYFVRMDIPLPKIP